MPAYSQSDNIRPLGKDVDPVDKRRTTVELANYGENDGGGGDDNNKNNEKVDDTINSFYASFYYNLWWR